MTEQISVIEQGIRQHVRFESIKGLLTTEDLFDLPLEQPERNKQPVANLDSIAVELDNQLQSTSKSFVRTKSKESTLIELKLEIVKYVIKIKVAEQEAKETAASVTKEVQEYLELLHEQEQKEKANMSKEEVLAKLNEAKAKLANLPK